MSYSRWSNSIWYTFWSGSSKEGKDNQVFEICDIACTHNFTYKELKEDMDACIEKVATEDAEDREVGLLSGFTEDKEPIYENVKCKGRSYSPKELDELKGYMQEFIEDVEGSYE
jgi:hypothetical protein